MTIYGEYLFLENALVGFGLLTLTGRLGGLQPSLVRMWAGSILCGLAAFILFLPEPSPLLLLLFRLVFPTGLLLLVFLPGLSSLRSFCKLLLVFYLLSFAAGGIALGTLYFTGVSGMTGGGFFYIGEITYLWAILGMVLAWFGLSALTRILRSRLRENRTITSLRIEAGDRSLCVKGFMDTGNFLRDPFSGKPVILAEDRIFQELWPEGVPPSRFRPIPFRSVGSGEGFLSGALPDAVILQSDPPKRLKPGIVIARCREKLALDSEAEGCGLILHPDILEGGIILDS